MKVHISSCKNDHSSFNVSNKCYIKLKKKFWITSYFYFWIQLAFSWQGETVSCCVTFCIRSLPEYVVYFCGNVFSQLLPKKFLEFSKSVMHADALVRIISVSLRQRPVKSLVDPPLWFATFLFHVVLLIQMRMIIYIPVQFDISTFLV